VADVELLRSLFDDWGQGEFSRGVALYADDMYFSTVQPEGRYDGHGPAGVRRFMEGFLTVWEFYSVNLDEIEELGGNRYLGSGTQFARGRESGTETKYPAYVAARIADGKIRRLVFSFTREEALAQLDE
jgi:ketosteroid isomerase-like protein